MKKLITVSTLSIFIFIMGSCLNTADNDFIVADLGDINNIEISQGDIRNYLNEYEPLTSLEIREMKISNQNNEYYLLVKCKFNNNENWIYIVELEPKEDKLIIKKLKVLNACESEMLSIDNFNIVNGEFKDCVNCNHKVMEK